MSEGKRAKKKSKKERMRRTEKRIRSRARMHARTHAQVFFPHASMKDQIADHSLQLASTGVKQEVTD